VVKEAEVEIFKVEIEVEVMIEVEVEIEVELRVVKRKVVQVKIEEARELEEKKEMTEEQLQELVIRNEVKNLEVINQNFQENVVEELMLQKPKEPGGNEEKEFNFLTP